MPSLGKVFTSSHADSLFLFQRLCQRLGMPEPSFRCVIPSLYGDGFLTSAHSSERGLGDGSLPWNDMLLRGEGSTAFLFFPVDSIRQAVVVDVPSACNGEYQVQFEDDEDEQTKNPVRAVFFPFLIVMRTDNFLVGPDSHDEARTGGTKYASNHCCVTQRIHIKQTHAMKTQNLRV